MVFYSLTSFYLSVCVGNQAKETLTAESRLPFNNQKVN